MVMGKIIITGPGRSGTTFLLQLLQRLGFDTGWEVGEEPYHEELRAGCEWNEHVDFDVDTPEVIREKIARAPRVLKAPDWSLVLKCLLTHELIDLDAVVLPIRDLEESACSRLGVGLGWMVDKELEGWERLKDQASILAMSLGRVVEACVLYQVPLLVLQFPTLVLDADYTWRKLRPILGNAVSGGEYLMAFEELARPEQIQTKVETVWTTYRDSSI